MKQTGGGPISGRACSARVGVCSAVSSVLCGLVVAEKRAHRLKMSLRRWYVPRAVRTAAHAHRHRHEWVRRRGMLS